MRFMTEYIAHDLYDSEPEWLGKEVVQAARETAALCEHEEDEAFFRRLADTVERKGLRQAEWAETN